MPDCQPGVANQEILRHRRADFLVMISRLIAAVTYDLQGWDQGFQERATDPDSAASDYSRLASKGGDIACHYSSPPPYIRGQHRKMRRCDAALPTTIGFCGGPKR
jgi:hypothetical protein